MAILDQLGQHDVHEDVDRAHESARRPEPKTADWFALKLPHEPQRLA